LKFEVRYSEEAVLQMGNLEKALVVRIVRKISAVENDPFSYFERLQGRQEYKLRVGDYRVIANIDEGKRIVFIRTVGHRKNVYQR